MHRRDVSGKSGCRTGFVLAASILALSACGASTGTGPFVGVDTHRPVLTAVGWTGPATLPGNPIEYVEATTCVDPHFCMAAGTSYDGTVADRSQEQVTPFPEMATFDGVAWSKPRRVGPNYAPNPLAVSCADRSFCVIVDGDGSSYVFEGNRWKLSKMPGFT